MIDHFKLVFIVSMHVFATWLGLLTEVSSVPSEGNRYRIAEGRIQMHSRGLRE